MNHFLTHTYLYSEFLFSYLWTLDKLSNADALSWHIG